ncbi:MAG: DUF2219 family protein [Maricaulaceae bacterium]|nr:DUF2219 family protein [Maricaulaceae bacterium]
MPGLQPFRIAAQGLGARSLALAGAAALCAAPVAAQSAGWSPSTSVRDGLLAEETPALTPAAARFAQSALSFRSTAPGALIALHGAGAESWSAPESGFSFSVYSPAEASVVHQAFQPFASGDHRALIDPAIEMRPSFALDYSSAFLTGEFGALFDIDMAPRAAFSVGPDGSVAGAGAQIRIGQHHSDIGERPRWFAFAGAERHALLYDPRQGFDFQRAMRLETYAVIGDLQAGFAMRVGESMDLSLAYVRRETRYRSGVTEFDSDENFAAISFSRRW